MSELSMSEPEREAFLADLHVSVIAVERPDARRWPCPSGPGRR